MVARITTTHKMMGGGSGPTVDELEEFLRGVPKSAIVSIEKQQGRDQMDSGSWTLTVNDFPRPNLTLPGHRSQIDSR